MPLTEKQTNFCINYVKTGNATQSAKDAGYSEKTAEQAASRLLRNVKVQKYIWELSQPKEEERRGKIADAQEILEYFSDVMRGKLTDQFGIESSLQDRTKCAIELAKRIIDTNYNGDDNEDSTAEFISALNGMASDVWNEEKE